jgi:hypothetical protein
MNTKANNKPHMQVITNPNKTIPNINEDTESEFIVGV